MYGVNKKQSNGLIYIEQEPEEKGKLGAWKIVLNGIKIIRREELLLRANVCD